VTFDWLKPLSSRAAQTRALKYKAATLVRGIAQLPGIKTVFMHPAVRGTIQAWPVFQKLYGTGWDLLHPFDRFLGTDTSGFVAADKLLTSPYDSQKKQGYAGSQPSIVRAVLAALPSLDGYHFVDLGCGKGRPLLVASEFPFRQLIGVELSPTLAREAKKNAAVLQKRFPERAPIRIDVADAGTYSFPPGHLVVFLYNPFGEEVIAKVVAGIEAALAAEKRTIFVVYYNPVFGACFDASGILTRYFAATLRYAQEEHGYGPDADDSVVVWQGGGTEPARAGAGAQIEITTPGIRAQLAWRRT
jgi:SAM-dependent methyltransferase